VTDLATGRSTSYAELDAEVDALARGLVGLGVAHGTFVNVMLPNRVEHLVVATAIHRLGAVYVAINAEFRGPSLARMLNLAQAGVLITTPELALEIEAVADELAPLQHVVLVGEGPIGGPTGDPREGRGRVAAVAGRHAIPLEDLLRAGGPLPSGPRSDLDPATVIFTSGTTGASKGVVLCHRALVRSADGIVEAIDLGPDDCVLTPYPLFHMRAAYLDLLPALLVGARAVLAPRFSASAFWPTLRDHEVTVFSVLGTVMQILWQREPEPAEREHRVRLTWGGPISVEPAAFEERFGIRVLPGEGVNGMSEVGIPSMSSFDPARSGIVREPYEIRIATDDDDPVPPGELGEILVRPREPGVLFSGYLGHPEATVAAWRNLWFHTGDVGTMDADGRFTFVGRKRDMIRRGGHNISTWEIEEVVGTHPAVAAAAAVGAPSELGEEEVVLFVVGDVSDEELLAFCAERMAAFMVPHRIVRIDEIPSLANGKPARARLVELATTG
jgi:crotonobetaine/carnitine-CoA ligase